MSDITTEKKLELIEQVRSQYNKNRYDMSNREKILYGRASFPEASREDSLAAGNPPSTVSFFKLRLLLALVMFVGVIACHQSGIKIAGITMEQFFQVISADYYADVTEFVESMSESVK